MTSRRAHLIQYTILTLVGAFGLVATAYGSGAVQLGDDTILRSNTLRVVVGGAGVLCLFSALAAMLSSNWRRTQAKLFFSFAVFVLLLALAEVGFRLAGFPAEPNHPRDNISIADAELGNRCRPNMRFRYLGAGGWVEGSTDAEGYRPSVAGPHEGPVVCCLGDSTTFCTEVADNQTWPEAAAQHLLDSGKPCRAINRGIAGYSAVQSMMTLRRLPDGNGQLRAVVYLFCHNDPVENFTAAVPAPLLRTSGDSFEVVPPAQPWLAQVGWLQFKPRSALQTAFRLWRFRTDETAYRMGALATYPYVTQMYRRFVEEAPLREGMRYALKGMKEECDRRKAPLLVAAVTLPFFDDPGLPRQEIASMLGISPETIAADAAVYGKACQLLRELVEGVGGGFIDLRGCLNGMTCREYAASPYDWHYSAVANKRFGHVIADRLKTHLK